MIFHGNGSVWDVRRGGILCRFIDGKYETKDRTEIGYLVKRGYANDGDYSYAEAPRPRRRKKEAADESGQTD
jgi:hypothetical protein